MRLPVEKIKGGLLHSDRDVRDGVVYYFARSRSSDPTIMPLVIEALSQHGLNAFLSYTFLRDLVQTDETMEWLIEEIERSGSGLDDREAAYHEALLAGLRHSDPTVLKHHVSRIESMQGLDDASQEAISERILLTTFDALALWREFNEYCDLEAAKEETSIEDYEWGCFIVQAMSRYPDQFSEKALAILSEDSEECQQTMAVRLAGELRLNAAVPLLLDLLGGDIWGDEEVYWTLAMIGNDAVVEGIATRYPEADDEMRITFASILENFHSDLCVQTCLRLLNEEKDVEIRGQLLQAVLMNFSSAGIEPARQYILSTPKTPDVLEVRDALFMACKLMEETFPEFEAWQEDSKHDLEFRRQWHEDLPLNLPFDEFEVEDYEDADDLEDFDEEPISPSVTYVRRQAPVGRNDPCPCGSGKKFKKCCYRKEDTPQETDEDHSASMSQVRPTASSQKFPIGTVALYGPDDKITTKLVAGVILRDGADAILHRWVGTNVQDNPKVKRQMQTFFDKYKVKGIVVSDGNMGCPHEEGPDFPHGEDCPFCPYWAGKQGSKHRD